MRKVEISSQAYGDLARLEQFLFDKSERAAGAAVRAIRTALDSLNDFPERGRPAPRAGLRELRIKFGRDGYVAQYRVTSRSVTILRIFHGRERRP